jgi:UPF0042 nucleotide-binding protein
VIFDVRDLRNPEHVHALRKLRGTDALVKAEVRSSAGYDKLLSKAKALKVSSVAFGCKSGHHRSVVIAEDLAEHFKSLGHVVQVVHRDISA